MKFMISSVSIQYGQYKNADMREREMERGIV